MSSCTSLAAPRGAPQGLGKKPQKGGVGSLHFRVLGLGLRVQGLAV